MDEYLSQEKDRKSQLKTAIMEEETESEESVQHTCFLFDKCYQNVIIIKYEKEHTAIVLV